MSVKQVQYEICLAEYANTAGAIALLKQYRLYLEMLPSLRRANESLIAIPLPIIRLRQSTVVIAERKEITATATQLPCDLAILMCDPEWKIKTGVEIMVFIHRPHEDFSDLLKRWRQTQVFLDKDYEWILPSSYQHILNEGANIYPLFVVFDKTSERIKRGLQGANLPFVTEILPVKIEEVPESLLSSMPPE
ncbi:hypothetical protein [Gloeocapsopsis dulcis]|uniref:Uncharacterized protein n=1 Tax=Gloeocapsopsis dulcis AAB1 = 1H9 TaxID=1433147 RepID=A0A6N8FYJ8_9CHRO|nr:hypothetical protein [Gloeocapsopsis dulcis]MUL38021.1 hypothetical protein [Gloeocapsopsis dulcis AAB1 = 1H9]WNN91499.1 hypothetical protein P0S91_10680 [Gloeocapsopsis dulcis]